MELIEEKKELPAKQPRFADDAQVPVRIANGETGLGKFARKMGGKWATDVKLWYIQYGKIKGTELEQHIVLDALEKDKAQ